MTLDGFRTTLVAFADRQPDLDRGKLLVEIRDELIEANLYNKAGELYVTEQDTTMNASRWIVERIARLPLLADRILNHIQNERFFINPAGRLTDRLEHAPQDEETDVDDVTARVLELLSERPAGTATGLYLTSDAGEGKTTLIRHLARTQAEKYKRKETYWLLVPISLGGRTFLRFDDVVTGTLTNTLRFPFLYYEAFVALVKMGFVVPALDGFEEMFVESPAGDAHSALGSLMNMLDSSGTALIAARRAYFEYKSLSVQTPLYASFGDRSAEFVRLALQRWDQPRFIQYAHLRGVTAGAALFEEVAKRFGSAHPFLTRAVLVERLMNIASDGAIQHDVIDAIDADTKDYLGDFVRTIVNRESCKWVDKAGDPPRPLLTTNQHHELLAHVALEMWSDETALLKAEVIDLVAEIYAESQHLGAEATQQILDRIKQHALIVPADGKYQFDHEEFYHFFLGIAVANQVGKSDMPDLRRALRVARLPERTVDTAVSVILQHGDPRSAIKILNAACADQPYASFVKENAGSIAIQLLHQAPPSDSVTRVVVRRMAFPLDALKGQDIRNAEFHDCYFLRSDMAGSKLRECFFERCDFGQLDLTDVATIELTRMHDCQCHSVVRSADESAVFKPEAIAAVLQQLGFEISFSAPCVVAQVPDLAIPEEQLAITERMCRTFLRSTGVNENTLKQRLGDQSSVFFSDVLPVLREHGVVVDVPYLGKGKQHRYELGVSLGTVLESIERADGKFERFLEHLAN